jgi:DNA-binding CsgD family transcriptional regulator
MTNRLLSSPLLSVVAGINHAPTFESVLEIFKESLAEMGADQFGVHFLPRAEDQLQDVSIAWQIPADWRAHYLRESYFQRDPAFRFARKTALPFDWASVPYDSEREPGMREVIERARDFNVDKQITIPVPGHCGIVGIVGIAGHSFDERMLFKPILQVLALHVFHRLEQLIGRRRPKGACLTEREREVLAWASEGKTAWEIGCILSLSQRTVEWHMRRVCKKLGATNRLQAIAILGDMRSALDPLNETGPA